MSRPINITSAVTFNPTGTATGANITGSTSYPYSNGYNGISNTSSYARLQLNASGTSTDCYIYYTFSVSGIPSDATIDSVSCVARIYANNRVTTGTSTNAASIQLYNGTTAKGSAQTGIGRSAANITISNTGSWTVSELNNIRLRIKGRRTNTSNAAYLYFYGADLTVNYSINGTEYEVSFVNDSYDTTTDPSTTQYVFQGESQDVLIYTNNLSEISVKDNGNDVTNVLVEETNSYTGSTSQTANSYTTGGTYSTGGNYGQYATGRTAENPNTKTSNAYASNNATAYTIYNFDFSSIPENAVIDSVNVVVNGHAESTTISSSHFSTVQLYAGNTAKGSSQNFTATTNYNITIEDTGTWTRSELQNAKLRHSVGNYGGLVNGITWTVAYTVPGSGVHYRYTISNISADHVITIDDVGGTFYDVTASSSYAGATVSPATKSVKEGRNTDIQIAVNNLYEIVVKDNGTVVTNSLVQNSTGYTYTVSNVQTAHTITVEEATYYTVTTSSTYAGATAVASPSKVYAGRNSTVEIEVDNLYEIVVKDNGTDITSSIVEMQGGSTTSNFDPTQYVSSASSYESIYQAYDPTSGVSNSGSTTRACVYSNTGSGAESKLTYKFDCSSIPENATITNVVCAVKCSVYQTTYFATRTVQLYHGDTAKGTATTISATGSNGSVITTNGGSWTRQELNDIAIVQRVTRSTSNATSAASFSFFGATLAVTYTTPAGKIYTITNVNTNHVITIEEAPYYTISTASTYANASASVSPAKLYSGLDANITVSVQNLYEIKIKLDGTDVTSNFTGSNGTYTYALQNVTTNHALTIEEAPYHTVTVNNSYQDATITVDPPKGYYGIDVDVRIQVNDIDEIKVMDNGVSVMANIINVGSGLYRYTINAINADHTITVIESTRYNITATSNYSEVTISPSSVSVIEGHSQTFVIEGDEDTDLGADIILLDNNVDVTSQMTRAMGETGTTSTVLGTFDSTNSQYVDVYTNSSNVTYYETNAEGHGCDYGISNSGSTRSSFYPATGTGSELIVFYNFSGITIPEGATITNVSAKAAVAPAYNGAGYTEMSLQLCIGTNPVGEATPISSASTDANEHIVDGGSGWTANDLANAKIKMYGVRNNTNSNNDNTGKRDNLNMCGADLIVTYSLPGGYLYTISNVQTAHTLVVNEVPATYYTVTASSSYQEATITPASQSVRQNHTAKLQISAASIYDIVVKDNGVNVTSELVQNETGFTYTTQKVTEQHTIVVEESESFVITTSSEYQDATITPASQSVRQGMSAVTYVEVANLNEISVKDNGVEVGDQLVLSTPGETITASGVFDTFDDTNSQYVGVYSTYDATNAEGKSASDGMSNSGSTRSAIYPATGAGSELIYFYNFGEVTGIPSNVVITNVSADIAISAAYSGQGYDSITIQLCIGTTPVGSPSTFSPQNAAAEQVNVDGGSGWTIADLSIAKIKVTGVRNSTNSNNDNTGARDNISLHGGTIVVTYTDGETFNGYTYTLQNIQTGHTIVITENPEYTLVASSNVQDVTITPASATVRGRESVIFNISGDISEVVVLDNGIDVTTQLRSNSTGYTYTISSVTSSHTIVVSEPSAESNYIKVDGVFRKVRGYYKKVNGTWSLIQKAQFDTQVSSELVIFGGVVVNQTIGEVETDSGAINISINDDALESGTYRMVYEDANRTPITGYTTINEFTIQ